MSNTSAKARLTQLREWLPTLKSHRDKHMKKDDPRKGKKFSKNDHYNKVNKHYGSKKDN
jgi:hypothetical protein|tara:strand:+ start:414 stop:590 length:177 start_codon:yes stop_codon:yes gene_type:complete